MKSKHGHSSAVESDADLSESTNGRSRSRTARRIAKAAMKARNRSETSSTFTGEGAPKVGDLGSSPEALPVRPLIAATSAKPDSVAQTNPDPPRLEQTVVDNQTTDRNPSPPLSVTDTSYESASTPALTAASATADDSDTDFQSARSTSPRDSYGDWERDAKRINARASVISGKDDHVDCVANIPKNTPVVKAIMEHPEHRSRTNSTTTVITSSRGGLVASENVPGVPPS
jgi:EEF1A N-terminal glycine/lysine methyltransferase